jgi:serine/threonine protein kinase/Tfp pilus assembly protein PilF
MLNLLSCPNGHQWNPSENGTLVSLSELLTCPVCKISFSYRDGVPARSADQATLPPRPAPGPAPSTPPSSGSNVLALSAAHTRPDSGNQAAPVSANSMTLQQAASELTAKKLPPPASSLPAIRGYLVQRVLGRGGMGVVYLAEQVGLKRAVALKMIRGSGLAGEQDFARFRAEGEAIARLHHPNIVQIYEVGEQDGNPFFSLEYVSGGALDKKLGGAPQPPRAAAAMTATLAQAIHAAHVAGIVHRDLKPANVLLTDDGTPKVTDFGLAKQLDDESGQTRSGSIMGTPSYMAPEQALGLDTIGPPADIYALGAMLYEQLTGRPPFRGATVFETLDQVKGLEPVPPSRLQPTLPRDLETICLKCLQKEPAKRYATALDLSEDLRRYQDGEPILARRSSWFERAVKYAKRRPLVVGSWALAASFLVSALAGGGYFLIQEKEKAEAETRRLQKEQDKRISAELGLRESEKALLKRDLPGAEAGAREVVALVGDEPALADLRQRAQRLQADATRVQQFARHSDLAKFHELQAAEEGSQEGHLQQAQAAAQAGLALFGLTAERAAAPDFGDSALPAEIRKRLTEDCYELYLTWANVVAASSGANETQGRLGLVILEQAPQLGFKTQAYHLRRARLLALLKDQAGAQKELERAAALPPTAAVDHFLVGLELYRRRALDQALPHLKAALELEPDHFWGHYYLAGCYLQTRRPALAHGPLSVCIQLKPRFVWSYLLRGFVNGQQDDFEAADADFSRAEKLDPDDVARYGILANRGVIRVKQGKVDAAIADFQKAIALRPKQWQAYANLADVYLRQGKPDEALAQLDKAIEFQPLASLYRTRAKLHLQRGNFAAAQPDLEQAIARTLPGQNALDLGRDHLERGRILYRAAKFNEALQTFDRALAVALTAESPSQMLEVKKLQAEAHQLRAEALLEINRFEEAVAGFEQSMKLAPATASAHRARGLARAKLGKYAEAVEDYTRALEIDRLQGKPADPQTLAYRGWAYLVYDAPKLAQRDFDEALRLKGANAADCRNGRGYALVLAGQWKLAAADADEVVRLKPELPRHLYNAARIYAQACGRVEGTDRQSQDLRLRFEQQAVKLVRTALEKLPADQRAAFWKEYVAADPAMRPIRQGGTFARLASEMPLAAN